MDITDAKDKIAETFWKLDLIRQAVRGIAHRGTTGEIDNVEDEALPVEDLIRDVRAELETAIDAIGQDAAA